MGGGGLGNVGWLSMLLRMASVRRSQGREASSCVKGAGLGGGGVGWERVGRRAVGSRVAFSNFDQHDQKTQTKKKIDEFFFG